MIQKNKIIRAVCTCYFGRLCMTSHKTWEEFENDHELIIDCLENFGYYQLPNLSQEEIEKLEMQRLNRIEWHKNAMKKEVE